MKTLFILAVFFFSLYSSLLQEPILQYVSSGGVVDMVADNNRLYVATTASCVDIFDIRSAKRINTIKVPKIKDFMEDIIDSKVYCVDTLDNRIVILSQGNKGSRRVHLFKQGNLALLISNEDQLYISKVRFLDKNTLILGLLGNELISYDIEKKKINWRVHVSHSKFSDLVLNEKKDEIVVADESGNLKILSVNKGFLIDTLSGQNLDNVFQVDYKNGKIATAGQDRRIVVYDRKSESAYYRTAPFLIYSVGLSPSGSKVGFASDENNNVTVFNTYTQETLGRFTGNKMTLTKILFLDENAFLVSSDDKVINLFQVK